MPVAGPAGGAEQRPVGGVERRLLRPPEFADGTAVGAVHAHTRGPGPPLPEDQQRARVGVAQHDRAPAGQGSAAGQGEERAAVLVAMDSVVVHQDVVGPEKRVPRRAADLPAFAVHDAPGRAEGPGDGGADGSGPALRERALPEQGGRAALGSRDRGGVRRGPGVVPQRQDGVGDGPGDPDRVHGVGRDARLPPGPAERDAASPPIVAMRRFRWIRRPQAAAARATRTAPPPQRAMAVRARSGSHARGPDTTDSEARPARPSGRPGRRGAATGRPSGPG